MGAQGLPAAFGGDPEDTGARVFVAVFECPLDGVLVVAEAGVGRAEFLLQSIRRCPKASETNLRKTRPRTTCLYSEASMFLRSLSAALKSFSSKPRFV
jgi:hypothetical protein